MSKYNKHVWRVGEVISAELLNAVENQLEMITPGATTIADEYNLSTTYEVGNYCLYNGGLWRCIVQSTGNAPEEGMYWTNTTLVEELNNGVDASIASDYSTTKTYHINDYVIYDNKLYRNIYNGTTSGSWNSDRWEETILTNDVTDALDALDGLGSAALDTAYEALAAATSAIDEVEALTSDIADAIASIPSNYDDLLATLATDFSAGTYTAGQYVWYNGTLYKFTSDHSGSWTGTDIQSVVIGDELAGLKSASTQHGMAIAALETAVPRKAPAIQINTEEAFLHTGINDVTKITFYGNNKAFKTTRFANKPNLAPDVSLSGTLSSVDYVCDGHYVTMNGTCVHSGDYNRAKYFEETFSPSVPTGSYKLIMLVDKGSTTFASLGNWDFYALYEGESTWTKLWNGYVGSSDISVDVTLTKPATKLRIRLSVGANTVYDNWRCWISLFENNVQIVDTEEIVPSDGEFIYSDNALSDYDYLYTMQHESVVTYVADTKEYINNHIPDIVKYWTENVYVLPEDFGAVGDGITDDTEALQDAIDYAITNKKVVKGYNSYKTTEPLLVSTINHVEIYINKLNYTGNDTAVRIDGIGTHFTFDSIESAAKGFDFIRNTGACYRHVIEGISLNCNGDCIYFGAEHTYYSTFRIRRVNSAHGNCITYAAGNVAEHVFYDFTCGCPEGWVAYFPTASKFYNFTVEGNCYYGVYDPSLCLFLGWRCREQMDRYERKLAEIEGYDAGPLFKFVHQRRASSNYINTVDFIRLPCLDVSELTLIDADEYASVADWIEENNQACRIDTEIVGGFIIDGMLFNQPLGKATIFGGKRIILPTYEKSLTVDQSELDLTILDGQRISGIANFATHFIASVDTTITLSASYNAIAFSRFTVDTGGHAVVIEDCNGTEIFDSTDYTGNKFEIRCISNTDDPGRFGRFGYSHLWCYDGTNHVWNITELS